MQGYLTVRNGILAFAYLAPAILAFARRNEPNACPAWRVLVLNLLLGWTIIGWFAALRLAVQGLTPQPSDIFSRRAADDPPHASASLFPKIWGDATSGPTQPASPGPPVWGDSPSAPAPRPPCPTCHGTGWQECLVCHGQPTRWVQPQSANATAVLWRCEACNGSGKIQCRSQHH